MPKQNYTHITIILDRSGSMASIKNDVQGGFDSFINEQKEVDGTATVTLVQFDSQFETVYSMRDISEVPRLLLTPRGGTALLDAMGQTMNSEIAMVDALNDDDKPEKCLFVVITDGEENSSREYTRERVFEMVEELRQKEDIDYDFVFIGANQDAIQAGGSIGVSRGATMNYAATEEGTSQMFTSLTRSITNYRGASIGTEYAFMPEEPEEQEKENKDKNLDVFGASINMP